MAQVRNVLKRLVGGLERGEGKTEENAKSAHKNGKCTKNFVQTCSYIKQTQLSLC